MFWLLLLLLSLVLLLALRCLYVWRDLQYSRKTGRSRVVLSNSTPKALLLLGSGGHSTELLQQCFHLKYDCVYCIADSDTTTQVKDPLRIPRARHVGQSYLSSILSTLYATVYAVHLILRVRPDVLIANGPGTCVPLYISAMLWRVLGLHYTRLVYLESYCRVQTLSLTGRVLYPFVDIFGVHWKHLQHLYPQSILLSSIIVNTGKKTS